MDAWRKYVHEWMYFTYMDLPWLKLSEDTCYAAWSLPQLFPQPEKQLNTNEKQAVTEMGLDTGYALLVFAHPKH